MKYSIASVIAAGAFVLGVPAFAADVEGVIRLHHAGVSADVQLAYVESSGRGELTDDEIKRLEDEGVSASVIVSMNDRPKSEPVAEAPAETYGEESESSEVVYAPPKEKLNISFFYDSLSHHGRWQKHASYGWVWQPEVVTVQREWRPYCDGGHWVWTDQGWYWESSYPWGWAAFHYGRWQCDPAIGWVWVPGTEWAPAWVHWRESSTHYGWAPLPPEAEFRAGVGFTFHNEKVGLNFNFGLNESAYAFVPCDRFMERDVATVVVPRTRVTNVYKQTTVVNNTYVYNDNRVINQGVPQTQVASRTRQKIETVRISEARVEAGQRVKGERRSGNTLTVYKPAISRAAPQTPPEIARTRQVHADNGVRTRAHGSPVQKEQKKEVRVSEAEAKQRLAEIKRQHRSQTIQRQLDDNGNRTFSSPPPAQPKHKEKRSVEPREVKRKENDDKHGNGARRERKKGREDSDE